MKKSLMLRTILLSFVLVSFLNSSLFVVTDSDGKVTHSREMIHTENAFRNQKATEYSMQAIFDEIHREEHHALRVAAAREHLAEIEKKKELAKQRGETYQLSAIDKAKLIEDAKYFRGGRYIWGGTTPQGFDCSGYVQYLYKKHNINLPRTALSQSKIGQDIALSEIKIGDLLFFNTDKSRGIAVSHVGIYMGNGSFIHAASREKGIIISPLAGHYQETFVIARRVADTQINESLATR